MSPQTSLPSQQRPGFKPDAIDWLTAVVAVAWATMQWWWASPLSFALGEYLPLLHLDEQKFAHLSFAIAFAAIAIARVTRAHYTLPTAALATSVILVVATPCLYLLLQSDALSLRAGDASTTDIVLGIAGLAVLLFFSYIELSRGLVVLSVIAVAYLLWGNHSLIPESLQWKGASLEKTISHLWTYTEGVFGISIGVATQFIFLFVLFGEILQRMGFGQFITRLSLLLLSGQKAGSAKAAILSSTAIGSISGSSTANVVTTGSFTIPLMIRSGMSKNEAGAVEVAASSNGQLMPPIMGAAAFLMAEYTNTPYHELIYHALLPALCAFFGLLSLVHLRACARAGASTEQRATTHRPRIRERLLSLYQRRTLWHFAWRVAGVLLVIAALWLIRRHIPDQAFFVPVLLAISGLYLYWMFYNARRDLTIENAQSAGDVWRAGRHFGLPILVLLWLLIVEGLSPQQSVWWSVLCALVMLCTHTALGAWFASARFEAFIQHYRQHSTGAQLCAICVTTAKRMLPISLATATAGIIVGTITLSGLQQVLGDIVLLASGDSLVLLLLMLALASLLLGLGLPTTPNYILISSLFAGVLYTATEQFGLPVSLVAIHLFILYFGVLADDTPPVGLCAYAASAISGGNPIRTGMRAFFLDIRTAILPFAFIFNPDLLLLDVGFAEAVLIFAVSLAAMYLFAAAVQSWFLTRNSFAESLLLLCASLTLLCPQWLHNQFFPRWEAQALEVLQQEPEKIEAGPVRLELTDPGSGDKKILSFDAQTQTPYAQTIHQSLGIQLGDGGALEAVDLFSIADDMEITPEWKLAKISTETEELPSPRWFWLLSLAFAAIVTGLQSLRRKKLSAGAQTI